LLILIITITITIASLLNHHVTEARLMERDSVSCAHADKAAYIYIYKYTRQGGGRAPRLYPAQPKPVDAPSPPAVEPPAVNAPSPPRQPLARSYA
jgi:hypothetical protein